MFEFRFREHLELPVAAVTKDHKIGSIKQQICILLKSGLEFCNQGIGRLCFFRRLWEKILLPVPAFGEAVSKPWLPWMVATSF